MADENAARPVFGDLLKQSQSALAGLQALEDQLSARLADQHAQLNDSRAELAQTREALTALQAAHERLTAEHAWSLDESRRQQQARIELEGSILDARRELAEAVKERQELIRARDRDRHELEDRLAHHEAALADRVSQIVGLEAQLDELAAAQDTWHAEREALVAARDKFAGRVRDLEAGERRAADELGRAISNREQLRTVYEDLKRAHSATTERSAAAFREMSRLQDEVRLAAETVANHEAETAQLKQRLAQATTLADELQTHQLTWAADREALLAAVEVAEKRRVAVEGDLAAGQLALSERSAAADREAAELRHQAAALQIQLADERERLEGALAGGQDQLRAAAESAQAAEKARAEAQGQYAKLVERAQLASQEWAVRRQAMTEENRRLIAELAQAHQAARAAEDGQRQRDLELQQLEQAHREKTSLLEDRLRAALDEASRPLTPAQSHRINTRLNAIVGFSSIMADSTALAPAERADYLGVIIENGRALAEELNLVPVAGAARPSGSVPAAAGPPVATLGGGAIRPTVLVADPDPQVRDRLFPFLTRAGYEVVFVADRAEAVSRAGALSPILVLADAALQPGGAPGLIAELKRDPRTADIPVVVTTRNLAEPLGVELGEIDILTKPIDRQQLLQVMINHDLQADARRTQKLPARVLVIDDDPLSVRLLTAVLKPLKVEVVSAAGGKAGIELARQCNPELIICDLMMPEVDGFDVIAALRADPQMSAVPILVYSGKSITVEDQQRLQGLIPSIIRKGEFSRERFLEFLLKRGERRARGANPPIAA
ncbi:MAG: response regulator [Candidatus Dormibacteraeota bacterium]|nr:response regulator [Candidatus Dormibacteraeota bacterium]